MRPLQRGDRAVIVQSHNPVNIGKIVTVGYMRGEHPVLGRLVRVHGDDIRRRNGTTAEEADSPISWLRRINDPDKPSTTQTTGEANG